MNKKEIEKNRRELRRHFQDILHEYPNGFQKQRVWELICKKIKKRVCHRDYGVGKMSEMLDQFSDLFFEVDRNSKTFLVPRASEFVVVSSISDESDDSEATVPTVAKKKTFAGPKEQSVLRRAQKSPASDWSASRTPRQIEKLNKLKEQLIQVLKQENGAVDKKMIWNFYNKRYLNPRTSEYGVKKMEEVFSFFSDVMKQEGNMIVLKEFSPSKVNPKPSVERAWGQGVYDQGNWGQGARLKGGSSLRGFATTSSSSESLDSIDEGPNLLSRSQLPRESKDLPQKQQTDLGRDELNFHQARDDSEPQQAMPGAQLRSSSVRFLGNVGFQTPQVLLLPNQFVQRPAIPQGSYSQLRGIQPLLFLGSNTPSPSPSSHGSSLVQPPMGMTRLEARSGTSPQELSTPEKSTSTVTTPPSVKPSAVKTAKDECPEDMAASAVPKPATKKDINVKPYTMSPGQFVSFDQLDSIVKDCIDILSDAEEYVAPLRIEQLLLKRFSRNRLQELNPNLRSIEQLKSANEHIRLLNKVNLYVHAFVKCRCICTVHELQLCMNDFAQADRDFSALRVGPIQKLPVVYDLFKFPAESEVLEITTIDILEHLRKFMNVKQLWYDQLKMEEVMQYLVEKYSVDSAYELGVRIRSLPLSVQMIKKSQRDAAANRRSVTEACKDELKKEITGAFQKFRSVVFQRGDDGTSEVRDHYLKQAPERVVREIFDKFQVLMSVDDPQTKSERRQHQKMSETIKTFLMEMNNSELSRMLFHLAVCVGNMTLRESVTEILQPPCAKTANSAPGETAQVRQPPPKADILERLKKYLDNCLASGSLSLSHLERIEQKLLEDFCFPTFHAFGFGSFLCFLLGDTSAKHLLDECGGTTFGLSGGSGDGDSVYRPHLTNLLEFIRQSKNTGITQSEKIEAALKNQFGTSDVRQFGHGNIQRLLTAADKPGKHKAREYRVMYEAAVCCNARLETTQKRVGVLGNMTKDQALICLHNCPLLEDLQKFSHWSLVFEPEHGKLRDFIQKYGGISTVYLEGGKKTLTTDIQALEVRPGKLLKLVSQTSTEKFEAALEQSDVVGTCGHLVSLVVSNKGIENMPLALMANQMKTTLFKLHASSTADLNGGGQVFNNSEMDPAVTFVLGCLMHLPLRIGLAVADQIFLETLGQVIGSTKSKTSLLQACQSAHQQHKLEKLACLLGVQEWVEGVHARCRPADNDVKVVITEAEAEELDEDLIMFSESESQSESETADSIASFLSDDEDDDDIIADADKDSDKQHMDVDDKKAEDELEVTAESKSSENVTTENETQELMEVCKVDENRHEEEAVEDELVTESKTDEEKEEEEEEKDEENKEEKEEEGEINVYKKTIDRIRRDEFGIGIQLDSDGERLMRVQQERLGRSLDRLSKDLYSKDTHFVLELVQNADDNSYPEEMMQGVSADCPTVKFIIDDKGIVVLNNESGFAEINIRAICDVGRSTKGKHKFGYIGQKGIGFKSVFRVTDRPEIHSNGYHICFDVKSGPMGYILPHWLDEAEEIENRWVTKIFLPLKPEMVSQTRSLAARFNDVHPSLLLFLHRLKQMIIENKIENSSLTMIRRDLGENIIEIEYNGNVDRWLVTKKMLDASTVSLQAKSGIEVESTEIAIAFPLKSKDHKLFSQALPPKQPVFAFLPLRSYGFRFIIQGDFDVPSSREDVDRDSPWNQWLRNEIHVLFIEALEKFKSLQEFSELEALTEFLQFIPLEDEILDFFRPVSSSILQKLKAKEFLPVQTSRKGSILWKLPSQTVIVRDPLIKEVISPELLQKNLNLFYLHDDVAQALKISLAQSLGVEQITVEHLLSIGKTLSQLWDVMSVETEHVTVVAKWLACLYRSLDEFHENSEVFETLKATRIIPLSTGKLICLNETTVFLPPGDRSAEKKGLTGGKDPLGRLQQDLSLVHAGLVTTADSEINSQVHKLLQRAGVKQLSPFDIVHHHILPILNSEQWQNKSRETLVSYVIYIKEQLHRNASLINMSELKGVVRVATNHGIKKPATDSVHFTVVYGNEINLPQHLPGYDWVLLDAVYLAGCTQTSIMQWRDFFSQLGVTDFLSVKPASVHITKTDMDDSPWAPLKAIWPDAEDGYYIEDFACEEFHSLVTHNSHPDTMQMQMSMLFEVLSRHWDRTYSAFATVQVRDKSSTVLRPSEDSSFSIHLRTLKWVPAFQLSLQNNSIGQLQMTRASTVMQPSVLYANHPTLQNILGHMVIYLEQDVSHSFALFLGIKSSIDATTVKELLIEAGSRSEPDTPAVFQTSLMHIMNIYQYLHENLVPKDLQDLFHKHSVIFIPDVKSTLETYVSGRMLGRDELWWDDPTGLFISYHNSMKDCHMALANKFIVKMIYYNYKDMFTSGVRVQRFPSLSEYAQLIVHITSVKQPSEDSVLSDVLNLFRVIGDAVTSQDPHEEQTAQRMSYRQEIEKVMKLLKKQTFLPTKKDLWVSLDDKPMLSNSKELEALFIDKPDVHFLQLTEKTPKGKTSKAQQKEATMKLEKTLVFVNLFPISDVSDCIVTNLVTEMMEPCPEVQKYMHKITPFIQTFLLSEFSDVYQTLIEEYNIAQRLTEISFWQVAKLEVTYSLKGRDFNPEIRQEKCIIDGNKFYFHKSHVESFPDINQEIAKYFSCGNEQCTKQLRSFLTELSSVVDDERGVGELLERHDIDELQGDETVWEVTPPVELPTPHTEPTQFPVDVREERWLHSTDSQTPAAADKPALTQWPPQASTLPGPRKDGEKAPVSQMWPPPKPPEYKKDFDNLPGHIRIERETSGEYASSGEVTRGSSGQGMYQHSSQEGQKQRAEAGDSGTPGSHGNREDVAAGENRKRKLGQPEDDTQTKRPTQQPGDTEGGEQPGAGSGTEGVAGGVQHTYDRGDGVMITDAHTPTPGSKKRGPPENDTEMGASPKRPVLRGDPIWTDSASEVIYEELGRGETLKIPELTLQAEDTSALTQIVGRWGEQLVHDYLLQQKEVNLDISQVIWVNKDTESGCPYDFEIVVIEDEVERSVFVEVKSTLLDTKQQFEISANEIQFALEHGESYQIYRIFNAGKQDCVRLLRIDKVAQKMDQNAVRLFMYI